MEKLFWEQPVRPRRPPCPTWEYSGTSRAWAGPGSQFTARLSYGHLAVPPTPPPPPPQVGPFTEQGIWLLRIFSSVCGISPELQHLILSPSSRAESLCGLSMVVAAFSHIWLDLVTSGQCFDGLEFLGFVWDLCPEGIKNHTKPYKRS